MVVQGRGEERGGDERKRRGGKMIYEGRGIGVYIDDGFCKA